MAITKKLKLYELDPRFYKDGSGDGIGDLKGLNNKVDYFKFLGVDGIILQNILSAESNDNVQNFTNVAKELGNINDLSTIISKGNTQGTKIFLELGIGSVKETHRWFNNSVSAVEDFENVIDFKSREQENPSSYKYNQDNKGYYSFDSKTQEVPLNWKSENVLDQFIKVIRFWTDLGVAGFVFKGFEYLSDSHKAQKMSPETLKELRKFYRAIKEINDDILIIGKSSILGLNDTNQYTAGSTQVFDYFMAQEISLIGTSAKHGNDEIGKFKPSHLAHAIKKYVNDASNILTFGSNLTGRINSRWGDQGQFSVESSKAIAMLLALTPASSSVYYGDELGMLNIGLTHLDDFQDSTLVARRKEFATSGKIKEQEFMKAQVFQNSINSRSLMAWNSEKNGGFSNSEKTITPVNSTYKEINVSNQFADEKSTLLFFKELMRIVGTSSYAPIIAKGKFTISALFPGVIKLISKHNGKEVRTFVNLTNKTKKISKVKAGKVVLSSYAYKDYKELPTSLDAYEAVMISKHTDEAIKLTQQIKIKASKEKEAEKAQAIKLAAQEEKARLLKEKELLKETELKEKQAVQEKILKEKELSEATALKEKELERENIARAKAKEEAIAAKEAQKLNEKQVHDDILRAEQEMRESEAKAKAQTDLDREARLAKRIKDAELKRNEPKEIEEVQEHIKFDRQSEETISEEKDEIENLFSDKAQRKLEKTRTLELKRAQKQEARNTKLEEKAELLKVKEAAKAEREAARILKREEDKFSIMDEEIHESERTTLREEDIAATTQIDTDNIDDFEAFLNGTKK